MAPVALGAESFRARVQEANALLRGGDVQGAMALYRDLQTDDPESDVLYYNTARGHYQDGLQEAELGAVEDARASFKEAREALEQVLHSPDPEIRKAAKFNRANCTAELAKLPADAESYDETVQAFKDSVDEYEDLLRLYPDHHGARTNLDYMRYLLKRLQQNPPPPQEQQGECENQDQDQEKQCEQGQDEQQQNEEQEQQSAEQQEQDADSDDQQDEPQQQQAQEAQQDESDTSDESEQSPEEEPPPEDRQNVEAILQSLEDIDEQEQRDARTQPPNPRLRNEWW